MNNLKIISWNLLHQSGALVEDISALIDLEQPDLFLMQEATSVIDTLPSIAGGQYNRYHWPKRRHGLAVWSPKQLPPISLLELPASKIPGSFPRRRAQLLEFEGITIANVHLSHGQFLNRLQLRKIAQSTEGPTAIIGDYNSFGPIVLKHFSDVGPKGSTHRAQDILPFRLDRCMVRNLHCTGAKILHQGASDHRPIYIKLKSDLMSVSEMAV